MKNILVYILVFTALILICYSAYKEKEYSTIRFSTSSPVEEMYHRQLVTTIDSILDSRYPCGVTEDDNVYPSIDSLSSIAVPNNR